MTTDASAAPTPPTVPPSRRGALGAIAAAALAAPTVARARPAAVGATSFTDPSGPEGAAAGPSLAPADPPDGPVGPQRARPRYDFPRRPPRRVVVDIAAAAATAREWDGREAIRSRVIVGAPRTPTPRMVRPAPSVRVNPPWYVPDSIAPKIERPEANGYRRTASGRLVLPPGPNNPLGPVRIGLQDSDAIFLHGTNAPGLFARENRALSHGCVRVERVVEVAAWVAGVTPAALAAAIATGRTFELATPDEVLVTLA